MKQQAVITLGLTLTAALGLAAAEPQKLGKPLTVDQPKAIHEILASPAEYAGKTVQVKGKVTEVCQAMGCWMAMADPADGSQIIRISVEDGVIVFPKDSPGKLAIAEGVLTKQELSREETIAKARHEAEEQGRKFDPKSITHASTSYLIQGTGAVILNESK